MKKKPTQKPRRKFSLIKCMLDQYEHDKRLPDAQMPESITDAGEIAIEPQTHSTAQHTPAPWHCYQPNNSPRQITDGEMRICTITDRSQAVANAKLIAAAPELLTVLSKAMTAIRYYDEHEGAPSLMVDALEIVKKATDSTAPAPAPAVKLTKPKFYLTFSNDDVDFFVPVGYVWTEDGLNDLHVQFDGPCASNYFPKTVKGKFAVQKYKGGKVFLCKSMEFRAERPERGFELSPAVLKSFWLSPNA